jgi:uncharacterized protein (TIGR02246 family)
MINKLGTGEADLEDRVAISDLFTRYCCALDNGEVETVVDCFTERGSLRSPIFDAQGRDQIREFAQRFAGQRAAGAQFRHMVTNIAVTVDGDRAAATAYLLVLVSKDGSHRTLPPGRYDCDLVKERGAWRFARRNLLHDHAYSLARFGLQ